MKRKTSRRVFCLALCLLMVLALYPVSAFAVTQDEIDALRAERDAVTAQREEKQAQVDALCPGRTWHDALYDAGAGAVLFAHILHVAGWEAIHGS